MYYAKPCDDEPCDPCHHHVGILNDLIYKLSNILQILVENLNNRTCQSEISSISICLPTFSNFSMSKMNDDGKKFTLRMLTLTFQLVRGQRMEAKCLLFHQIFHWQIKRRRHSKRHKAEGRVRRLIMRYLDQLWTRKKI